MRFRALDSWRGICALAVALFHFPVIGYVRTFPLVAHAFLFVDFFFVLSGFVISYAFERRMADDRTQVKSFVIRRFGRLWPLHAFVLGLFVAINLAQGEVGVDERHSVLAIFTNLALIHGLGIHKDLTWNGPSWSISVEFFLYLVFALLTLLPRRLLAYLVLIVTGLAVLVFHAPNGMASTFDYGVFRGLAGFFTGAIIARLPLRPLGVAWEIGAVALVAAFVSLGQWMFLAPFVFGAAIYVFAGSVGGIGRALTLPPALALGNWSYSIYMNHALVVALLWAIAPRLGLSETGTLLAASGPFGDLIAIPYLALIVAMSAVTYHFVEAPSRAYFNALATRPRPQPAE